MALIIKHSPALGNELSMKFNLTVFTGNKFCLFNYATKTSGGYVDFDWFRSEVQAQSRAKITVDVDKPGHTISPVLFGVFFEDINLSADGGIYPELVRNRSFEDADTLQNWKFVSADGKSSASISTADVQARPPIPPLNPFNRKSLLLNANGSFKLENYGYWGMNIVKGNSYSFKLAVRSTEDFNAPLKIRIMSSAGEELASGEIKDFDNRVEIFFIEPDGIRQRSECTP